MGKKRNRTNEILEMLIDELIDARKRALGDENCPICGFPCYGFCPSYGADERRECKKQYYENMRVKLLKNCSAYIERGSAE